MKNWILIIDSLNGILADSIANKEIAYTCNNASKVSQGDRLLGYIATPVGEIRMILTATRNGTETTLFLEKLFEVSSGCKVNENLYAQILAVSSIENKCLEISEDSYNDIARDVFESINTQKQILLNDTFLEKDDWYSTPATEYEYNTFKKLLRYFVEQLNINNGLIIGDKNFANGGTSKAIDLIKEWNKFNGFELSCRFASGYQLTQDNAHYLNYAWVNLNPHFDKQTHACVSLNIKVKPDMNVLYKGNDYIVEDLDLDSEAPANDLVKKIFDELRTQIYKWQQGDYDVEDTEIITEGKSDLTVDELAIILQKMYNEAPKGKAVSALYSFGLMYGDIIVKNGYKSKDIVSRTTLSPNMDAELDKAKNLYVSIAEQDYSLKFTDVDSIFYGRNISKNLVCDIDEYVNRKHNRIVFGAPGTGKSHTLNKDVQDLAKNEGATFERVTFHPEYSYSSFVGCYKPVSETDGIEYKYVAGPFMRVLVEAYKSGRTEHPRPHILLIEEINRARVAAVFGEVFQLLDRDAFGQSEYEIAPSEDVKKYLLSELGGTLSDYEKIRIPNNMFIWATMNSADQGVFPMDTAFKRRWNFEYIGIDDNDTDVESIIKIGEQPYDWNQLRKAINAKMSDLKVNEDKLLGPYFIGKQYFNTDENDSAANTVFIDIFKNKVLMYLFEDACKQKAKDMFEGCDYSRYSRICDAFDKKGIEIFGKTFKTDYYDKEQ